MMPTSHELETDSIAMLKKSKSYNIALSTDNLRLYGPANRTFGFIRVILENMVHLLECPAHSLRHKEVRPDTRENTENRKEHVRPVAGVLNERWSDEALH